MKRFILVLVASLLVFARSGSIADMQELEEGPGTINVPGEHPFDAINIFGDFAKSLHLQDTGV